jgi:hypothetical protein
MALPLEPLAGVVGVSGGFLQNGVSGNHLARNEILADAEMLKGTLGLSAPQFVSRNLDLAKAVGFSAVFRHTNQWS